MTRPPSARLAGLDGLRAVAVLLVVVYHLFPALPGRDGMPGAATLPLGFVGVDVFFVISGFLITTLLLRERDETGSIALGAFWRRRARRLLPAIAVMVLVCASLAWMVGGDVLVGLGTQIAGAATFAYNWVAIASGSAYFGAGSFDSTSPELLRNLWSLGVEEQFYLLWPLLLPAVLLLRRWRVAFAVALAAASAVWAAVLVGDGVTRVYYGTDTHAYGLLLGVALAFVRPASRTRGVPGAVGALAVAALVALALLPSPSDAVAFPWLLVAASALTVVAIAAAVRPGAWLGRALDVATMRWIGERSFGLYLWHWPLVVLLTYATTGSSPDVAVPLEIGALSLILTLIATELSYRFVEQPVRRRGLRGSARALDRALRGRPTRRAAATAGVAAGALVVAGTTAAVAHAPDMGSSESVVARGQYALDAASTSSSPGATLPGAAIRRDAAPLPPECATANLSDDDGLCVAPDGRPAPPAPAQVAGARVTAVGDSVMLASAPSLLEGMPGIDVDAKVSRSMSTGADIVARLAERDRLRDYVVVGLGTNGAVDPDDLKRLREDIGPKRTLVLVTAFAPRDWIPGVNRTIDRFAAKTPGVVVADWSGAIRPHADLLAGDKIHPGGAGGRIFADTVEETINGVENERAELQYRVELAQWSVGEVFGDKR
ncbi:peptidoglycan/LPS O-acetylase OafA/YrhL/lysophospholipase L1-like esterase [Microbacterium marinum]|uniref:Peptidoglycan/LPS O-acetylase OafA/YrhL/lysophospholipase L1-like esterase n=1 Tax=Microbacterium marinum TaxID=421115 RepID=A0A7W7BR19_9MICO|nr:acyltransferase family protein [Microbacterium marinum]MBB4666093.1 peptidoglycan/LPS O-acetylase OafA/YrhL/lysophospholipase L1-like esterase [Microbacterium marinum]